MQQQQRCLLQLIWVDFGPFWLTLGLISEVLTRKLVFRPFLRQTPKPALHGFSSKSDRTDFELVKLQDFRKLEIKCTEQQRPFSLLKGHHPVLLTCIFMLHNLHSRACMQSTAGQILDNEARLCKQRILLSLLCLQNPVPISSATPAVCALTPSQAPLAYLKLCKAKPLYIYIYMYISWLELCACERVLLSTNLAGKVSSSNISIKAHLCLLCQTQVVPI